MSWQTQYPPWDTVDGSVEIANAEAVTTDGVVGSTVTVGRGPFWAQFTVSGYEGEDSFDTVTLIIQANTVAASSTWTEIGNLALGDATGRGTALTSVTDAMVGCYNFADNQVRLYAYVNGSAVKATVTCYLHPIGARS